MLRNITLTFLKLLLYWILVFDIQRLLFSLYHWSKFRNSTWFEWVSAYLHSFRLDLATSAALCAIPMLFLSIKIISNSKVLNYIFYTVIAIELLLISLIHSGEINVYDEWNHKLTARVFKHLSNPDEVFRTAAWSMTLWYVLFLLVEIYFCWKLFRFLVPEIPIQYSKPWYVKFPISILIFILFGGTSFLLLRGGIQQIPLNINSAIYSNKPVNNDLSVNPSYHFFKSYLLYNRTEIDAFIPKMDSTKSKRIVEKLYKYPKKHSNYILNTKKPNIVFVILEGWSAEAIGEIGTIKGATPNMDKLIREGYSFTNMFAASGTSEIGNSTILSGFPAIPEVSITMQPEKSRKIGSLNQDLQKIGYSSGYLFGGDLKYGNIGGYLLDHQFNSVRDENNLPNIPRGKLNYYDKDLYRFFLRQINTCKEPFFQCTFTGSSHAPYDHPKNGKQKFKGVEEDYMNSIVYSDLALGEFISKVKKEKWFKNTLFVFVADHGHCTPVVESPHVGAFFRIPCVLWGETIKKEYIGQKNKTLGSQSDLVATLLYQLKIESKSYPWSKDLMNPKVPQFALHTINKGYGWMRTTGNFTFQMHSNLYIDDNFPTTIHKKEVDTANAMLNEVYKYYKKL